MAGGDSKTTHDKISPETSDPILCHSPPVHAIYTMIRNCLINLAICHSQSTMDGCFAKHFGSLLLMTVFWGRSIISNLKLRKLRLRDIEWHTQEWPVRWNSKLDLRAHVHAACPELCDKALTHGESSLFQGEAGSITSRVWEEGCIPVMTSTARGWVLWPLTSPCRVTV